MQISATLDVAMREVPADKPVLIAGPTASGKSALALEIAARQGGVIVNADASQVYKCWRVITARPLADEEAQAKHALYGYIGAQDNYSTGHWLRDVAKIIARGERAIVTGGTGLYFAALTQGLAEIPPTPPEVRQQGDLKSLREMLDTLDPLTSARIDTQNRARVQRAWEVLHATGRGLASWQANTGPPILPLADCYPIVFDVGKDWLNSRIAQRFDMMLAQGAMDEVAAVLPTYDTGLPAHRAIGVPELVAHLRGQATLDQARDRAVIATRQFAKRQRTWMRSRMRDWHSLQFG